MSGRKASPTNINKRLVLALLTAITGLITVYRMSLPRPGSAPSPNSSPLPATASQTPLPGTGRLKGVLTDRAGNPLTGLRVSIKNGPQTLSDAQGQFVLNGAPTGDQILVVENPHINTGPLTQALALLEGQTTQTKIVYDAANAQLGLLAITAPLDTGELEIRRDGKEHRATVYGRCDGLGQMLGRFDVWVLLRSERDSRLWVQHPSAIIDAAAGTWRANVRLGDPAHPPRDGERWDLVAVAAEASSAIRQIANTPQLTLPPPHLSSNVVTATAKIVQ